MVVTRNEWPRTSRALPIDSVHGTYTQDVDVAKQGVRDQVWLIHRHVAATRPGVVLVVRVQGIAMAGCGKQKPVCSMHDPERDTKSHLPVIHHAERTACDQ